MQHLLSRRSFLGGLTTLSCAASLSPLSSPTASHAGLDFPLVDFHVHLDNSKIEMTTGLLAGPVLASSRANSPHGSLGASGSKYRFLGSVRAALSDV
jgi:hypothetical protein